MYRLMSRCLPLVLAVCLVSPVQAGKLEEKLLEEAPKVLEYMKKLGA